MCACIMCMYIRKYIYRIFIFVCLYAYIYIYIIRACSYIHINTYWDTYACMFYVYIHTYIRTYIHIYVTYKHTSITQCFPLDICTIIIYLYCVWEHICIQLLILLSQCCISNGIRISFNVCHVISRFCTLFATVFLLSKCLGCFRRDLNKKDYKEDHEVTKCEKVG